MQSPQRRADARAAANRTRRETDAANEWAQSQGIQLDDLDGGDASPGVLATTRDIAETPTAFASQTFRLDMTEDEARAHYGVSRDDYSLAILNQRYSEDARRNELLEWLDFSERQLQRRLREAGKRFVNFVQIATNTRTMPEAVFDVLNGLPDEVQAEVARLAQRDADMRAIEKAVTANARKRRLSEGVLRVLDAIERNTAATRERLAGLSIDDQKAALVDLVAEWRRDCRRARANEWRSEHRFQAAVSKVAKDNTNEMMKRFRALPIDKKERVAAEIVRDIDEEVLQ